MKYRDPVTGEFKEISVKASDTLPIGTIVDYDGDTVPDGWETVDDTGTYKKIKKIATSIGVLGKVLNSKSASQIDTYSCDYINNVIPTMETGTVKLTGASNNWSWTHITYTKEYDKAPYVFTQINDNTSTQISTVVINRTTTGCDVGIYNHNYTRTINYLVVKAN